MANTGNVSHGKLIGGSAIEDEPCGGTVASR
jgi:hypothetical protein